MDNKVIITGSFGVGKTSLFNRIVYQKFEERYLTTIGVKVGKKKVTLPNEEVSLTLWDVAGEVAQDKVPVSYFVKAKCIVYVFDVARPNTYGRIAEDLKYLAKQAPDAHRIVVANKCDLLSEEALAEVLQKVNTTVDFQTSALTGAQIDALSEYIAKQSRANS